MKINKLLKSVIFVSCLVMALSCVVAAYGEYPEPNFWWNNGTDFIGLPTNENFADGVVGRYYESEVKLNFTSSMYFSRWHGYNPYTYVFSYVYILRGSLPPDLHIIKTNDGVKIYGTPTRADIYSFTPRAVNSWRDYAVYKQGYDNSRFEANWNKTFFINVTQTHISGEFKSPGKVGESYFSYVTVNGGTPPYRFARAGTLPPGLSLSGHNVYVGNKVYYYVYLTGTPSRAWDSNPFAIRVVDANNISDFQTFKVKINRGSSNPWWSGDGEDDGETPAEIMTKKLPDATIGLPYTVPIEAAGTQPITWTIDDKDLPEGLTLSADGTISFLPTELGKYKLKVTAENEFGKSTKKFTLKVVQVKPAIITVGLPDGDKGVPYSYTIEALGTGPLKFSKSGKFPKGLKLDKNTGEIYGVPTKAGSYTFKLKVKNKAGKSEAQFQIVINDENSQPQNDNSFIASFVPVEVDNDNSLNDLYVITQDEELYGDVEVPENSALTFGLDEWTDEYGDDVEVSDVKVFMNGKEIKDVKISDEGTFTLPAELVNGEFSVYVSAKSGDVEFKTSTVKISAQPQDENASIEENSSGECNLGLSGLALITLCGALLFKKQ